jgi:tetratricopeptide (TPR) repeat protein
MDIWRWLEDLEDKLVKESPQLLWMIYKLPELVVNEEHHQVDALMPEALAQAKQFGHPWLEIYFGHWDLQSRIIHRSMISESMQDAIDLLERAHREENSRCPQSICVVQDICTAYGRADGIGYVDERLIVARETLEKIDPSWPCWRCISCEYADALLDQDQFTEALEFVDQQFAAMCANSDDSNRAGFRPQIVNALIGLNRLDEALEFNQNCEYPEQGKGFLIEKRIDQARLLVRLSRIDEAIAQFPLWREVEDTPSNYFNWAEVVYLLGCQKINVEDKFGPLHLIPAYRRLSQQGVMRQALSIAHWTVDLLLQCEMPRIAEEVANDIEQIAQGLRSACGADHQLAQLRTRLKDLCKNQPPLPDEMRRKLAINTGEQSTQSYIVLCAAEQWKDWWDIQVLATKIWARYGFPHRATQILENALTRNPDHPQALNALAKNMFDRQDEQAFAELYACYATHRDPDIFACIKWHKAQWEEQKGQRKAAIAELEEVVVRQPHNRYITFQLAILLRIEGRLNEALDYINHAPPEQMASFEHWERMLVATRLGKWAIVRESCQYLGLKVADGDGPIYEYRETCQIVFVEDGRQNKYYAIRTGPVTAEIIEIAAPESTQHFHDHVAFEAKPLNPPTDEELATQSRQEMPPLQYMADQVLEPGNYQTFTIQGVHPGEQAILSLKDRLREYDAYIQIVNSEDYEICDQKLDQMLPGIYAYLAVGAKSSPRKVESLLLKFAAETKTPLIWPELLQTLKHTKKFKKQQSLAKRFDL